MAYPTNPIYKLLKDPDGKVNFVQTQKGDSEPYHVKMIPFNEANTDYKLYLEWVAAGNTAEAADPGPSDWDVVREKRDRLLKDSDWAMTTGATIDQAQWSAYREKLRDIPQTYKDKETSEIVWPTAPSSKGPNS
tara:strand:- start:1626 stop:2027 length:402 start_codon:yes stop_codon:yes gene_type:complete